MQRTEALPDLPIVGSIRIDVVLNANGTAPEFSYEGMSPEQVIGYLTVVKDRMREIVARDWPEPELDFMLDLDSIEIDCPHCGETVEIDPQEDEHE
jgi:hypothetical protein